MKKAPQRDGTAPRLSLLTVALILLLRDGGATLRAIAKNRRVKKKDGTGLTQQVCAASCSPRPARPFAVRLLASQGVRYVLDAHDGDDAEGDGMLAGKGKFRAPGKPNRSAERFCFSFTPEPPCTAPSQKEYRRMQYATKTS